LKDKDINLLILRASKTIHFPLSNSMKSIYPHIILFLLFLSGASQAQNFKIYKGDTINRIDGKGLKQGIWMKFDKASKPVSTGNFLNGVRKGKFISYNENGKLQAERIYAPDGKNSRMKVFYEGGKLRAKGNLNEENKDSTWLYYNDLGVLVSEEYYVNGSREGIWKTYYPESGKIVDEIRYSKGRKEGVHKEYFQNGHLKMESTLSDSSLIGPTKMYHPNGNIWMEGIYLNGLQEGNWKIYKEEGDLERTEVYSKGVLLETIEAKPAK
jgi:antitoxin component YwqK of YwqJK toxin-antitoxin module